MNKREIGKTGEIKAAKYLESMGVNILERNYQNRFGEIDIIGKEGNILLFIEVKYRKNESFGYPLESIGYFKRERIKKLARYYLNEKRHYGAMVRFDCIGIIGDSIYWVKGAFY